MGTKQTLPSRPFFLFLVTFLVAQATIPSVVFCHQYEFVVVTDSKLYMSWQWKYLFLNIRRVGQEGRLVHLQTEKEDHVPIEEEVRGKSPIFVSS